MNETDAKYEVVYIYMEKIDKKQNYSEKRKGINKKEMNVPQEKKKLREGVVAMGISLEQLQQ